MSNWGMWLSTIRKMSLRASIIQAMGFISSFYQIYYFKRCIVVKILGFDGDTF